MTGKIVNLTPHEVVLFDQEGKNEIARYPASGVVARVSTTEKVVGELEGVPLVNTEYGEVTGLPSEPEPGTYYVVSILVAQAVQSNHEMYEKFKGRILVPNTSPTPLGVVRDEQGRIRGVKSFIVF